MLALSRSAPVLTSRTLISSAHSPTLGFPSRYFPGSVTQSFYLLISSCFRNAPAIFCDLPVYRGAHGFAISLWSMHETTDKLPQNLEENETYPPAIQALIEQ
ncbi:hypothetical protein K402DRAFT_192870 [Aulographum hederae CBS 113979]|uniref:Uncharacterized protein n=1 Tax=Aulographum hederae CBS 113979 TaxID=1176131 RepID=A0A6G1GNI2_9PEZI|nr:hypothetical protein K402DRAFT_192870 [Aulographum hederae CBS 113979]